MFKLESYITPIILSYVNRYINNFKPEDSQVSLWGGDATFHNLELNLEVLEQELQLPFSFISGSIRELTIHVPWTKIASEPIRITINTIECILNLKGKGVRPSTPKKKGKEKVAGQHKDFKEAPPGYIQSLINKIVSNISIHCNNLILKYVEEDIVLSINVKLLKFESANEKWEPAYTDLSPAQVILRKVISVNDLTLCLDKRNASGKIEVYQEPMLYRCSMTMHLLRNYHSATANVASTTRLDIYCNNMEFSMTEQQVPMLMRLLMLLYALQQKQLKPESETAIDGATTSSENKGEYHDDNVSWTGWAWSYVSSVLPAPWEDEWDSEDLKSHRGHTLHFGIYIDRALITFKVSESNSERGYYSHKKIKYHPMLTLDLTGIYSDTLIHGIQWFNCTGGISEARLVPVGNCSCGNAEVNENTVPYLKIGALTNTHKIDSLFDAQAIENKGGKREYNTSWEYHMTTTNESILLEKTPAFAFDYVYQLEIPNDFSSEMISDLGSNFEFSNLTEESSLRLCFGPFKLRICSGLLHRFATLNVAASYYDYPPYYVPKPDLPLEDLLPPSSEDFDALSEFIPQRSIRITLFAPMIELELMDHQLFEPVKGFLFRKSQKLSTSSSIPISTAVLPKVTLESQFIDISQTYPMYVNRLVHTTCQLPEPPQKLFDACFVKKSVKVVGLLSRLVTNPVCQSIILAPSSISYGAKTILSPQYWTNSDIPHEDVVFESESLNLNGTKAKMLVVYNIVERFLAREPDAFGKSIYSSSLLADACKDYGFPYMEISIEGIRFKRVVTNSTQTLDASVDSIKAFIFESGDIKSNNLQQVLFISGPETTVPHNLESSPLLTATIQFPLKPERQAHPPIVIFNLQEIRICIDPLLCKWLLYVPRSYLFSDILLDPCLGKTKNYSEASGSIKDTSRRLSGNHLESVHSSSDREHHRVAQKQVVSEQVAGKQEPIDMQEKIYNFLKVWFEVWKGMYLYGDVSQCTVYCPMDSLSAIGSQGIQEAIEQAINRNDPPDILVITLPFANIRSAQRQNVAEYLNKLPVTLPDSIWTPEKSSFPWTMSISELSCFTMQRGEKLIFLKPVSLSATVGLSTRPSKGANPAQTPKSPESTAKKVGSGPKKEPSTTDQKRKLTKTSAITVPQSGASSSKAQYNKSHTSSPPNSPVGRKGPPRKPQSSPKSSKIEIGYLGVCVHIDTTPVVISTSEVQVYLFASILYGIMEVFSNLLPAGGGEKQLGKIARDTSAPVFTKDNSTLSASLLRETATADDVSDKSPPPLNVTVTSDSFDSSDSVKLTAWVQWTITRFTVELLSSEFIGTKCKNTQSHERSGPIQPRLKLVLDAEDIVSSLDFQSIYLKVKSKIGSASIQHYERLSPVSKWQPGAFSGIVMRLRDDLATGRHHPQRQEQDSSLVSVTITRASCQHTHTLWGAVQKRNKEKKPEADPELLSKHRYITEIVVNVQPLDFVVSLYTLRSFYMVLVPLLNIPGHTPELRKTDSTNVNFLSSVSNQTLPLAYLDCQDVRVIMPSKELCGSGTLHDVLVLQLQKISLNPQAVNPICRNPIRPDIYDQAAHARILHVPGSEVEDRQYQLDITGISICTGRWEDISAILTPSSDLLSNLRGMSENPALEWNILEQGQPNTMPSLNLKSILEKFDLTIVVAPSMVYKDNTTICGHATEVNLVSDIFVYLSLQQIKLVSTIFTEFVLLITPLIVEDGIYKKPTIRFPYSRFESAPSDKLSEKELVVVRASKDSGFETSDVKSVQSSKVINSLTRQLSADSNNEKQQIFPRPPNTVPYVLSVPLEVTFTAGKVAVTLYNCEDERSGGGVVKHRRRKRISKRTDEDQGYEASEESTDDKSDSFNKYEPLLYLCFTQPNAFYSKQQLGRKFQVSCFDINFKLSGPEYTYVTHIPCPNDFPISLLETKLGTPNPQNGILPAFFTLKYIKGVGKNSKIELEILKPTKVLCQMSKWSHLLSIKDKLVDTFNSGGGSESFLALLKAANSMKREETASLRAAKNVETFNKFYRIKTLLGSTNSLSLKFDQLILAVTSESGHELHVGMRELKSQLFLATRPEKLCLMTTFDCLTLTVIYDSFRKLLLNPWTVTFDVCVFWESWQDSDSEPQIQLTAESECILVDVTAEQIRCLEMVIKDLQEFTAMLPNREDKPDEELATFDTKAVEKDQHYKDDLRAGAFQFVDSNSDNTDEMPLPYQVMFWTKNISAMAWRYPQPRALTKVRIFPVPYKMALNTHDSLSVLCHLEYWSECRNCYLPYTQFCLSESEICHLTLPDGNPKTVVASTWRVVINTIDDTSDEPILDKGQISPRALAACMRIDSYFNKTLIPNLNVALYITKLELALYNYFPKGTRVKLPECLRKYTCDNSFPESQKFLTVSLENVSCYTSTWNFEVVLSELSCSVRSEVLDYAYLTEQTFIEPFTSKLELCLFKGLQVNFISKPVQMKFGPSIAHTLAISGQMWTQNYINENQDLDFVIVTRYAVCNDTDVCIRFGQEGTDENLLVPSRTFHLYAWKSQKQKQTFRISLEQTNWTWSKGFSIYSEGTRMIHFPDRNLTVFVTVKNVSKTQKQITFFGQLVVCNMLSEHFEMKIMEAVQENKEQEFKNAPSHIVGGRTAAPSMFVDNRKNYFLRLRFFGLESAWTGDIPLREHATGSQPWLVKVPLQERGQFLSIWCRILIQDFGKSRRVLAMLWPLFMVKSNLPMSAKVHIETPTLGVHLDSMVNGRGELQQLYCPGTIDHSHQITFQLEEGNSSTSNPYVPLNYTVVDQREFFKKYPNEDVEVILESLNHCFESKWPYFEDEFNNIEWIMDDSQPLTHVQVRYQNACQYSCALLVELLPWCLMVNTLGTPVSVMLNGIELCRVQHHGIIAPPRLDENFHLGVCSNSNWFFSGPLQLAKSDWAQSFYMPKITGNIPLEGTIKTHIKCDLHLCMLSITSTVSNEIRLLRVGSTHVLSNHLASQVHVVCYAVPDSKSTFDVPSDVEQQCFTVVPHLQKSYSGIPIMQWYMLKSDSETSGTDYVLYVSFSADPELGWSSPISVDKPLIRKAFALSCKGVSMPVVLTAQEQKGQIFLSLHNDPRPQLLIDNKTNVDFYCGQSLPDDSGVYKESEHFNWICKLNSHFSTYYSMPKLSEKFPELPQVYFAEKISLAYETGDNLSLEWSAGVSIVNNNDLFIRVPYYGDVKLTIVNTACTTFLTIESVSQVEISARDIRVRLSMREMEKMSHLKGGKEVETIVKSPNYTTAESSSFLNINEPIVPLPCIAERHQSMPNLPLNSPTAEELQYRVSSKISGLVVNTLSLKNGWESINLKIFVKSFGITLISDIDEARDEHWEIASLVCDDVTVIANQTQQMKVKVTLSDIQLDNQLYARESFDFPVVLVGQDKKPPKKINILSVPISTLTENTDENALIVAEFILESWRSHLASSKCHTGIKSLKLSINPISCYVEDIYVTRLMNYLKDLNIIDLVIWPKHTQIRKIGFNTIAVNVPELVQWQCALLASPLTIKSLYISPVSMLLSVHSSVKLYIALDQSPLNFARFERKRLFTSSYRLGHALTMHYLSGAIFGAGWVVSSLELLGSPGGLARAMGTGLRDFVSLPYRGLVEGPMAFLRGITTGSASLMRHVTAGTLQSVTKLASSVARNLDRLTLDEEHQKRTEEQRRQRPQGVAQGFMQGMTSFGISLLGAVGGIAHHPLQSMINSGASPRSIAAGVGLGLVGVITKPLSGAAELVAMTGQGLLQGAGWNPLPDPRARPQILKIQLSNNSTLKYPWKLVDVITTPILLVIEATSITQTSIFAAVALILTVDSVFVINLEDDEVSRVFPLEEITVVPNSDPTILVLKQKPPRVAQKDLEKIEDELAVNMDPDMRARVADYVRSTVGLLNPPEDVSVHSGISISPLSSPELTEEQNETEGSVINFYVSAQQSRYFICLLNLATQQRSGNHFPVL
ncbi:intermembrane lipid transfer protein VPS13B [Anthonomus grandis grandis]|uniref:intermembrane lipid transfer protein VPS13B n=1 Tax=Anthonomus grandis grandis TaxID=2921223 RepID=UPI0021666411|nr:intermembrane lipid transfer protein VPS13B [Anthonomus grandis grandis]